MESGNWFWHSRFMAWVEGALLDLTNWVWNKRHSAPPIKATPKKDPVLKEQAGEATPSKSPAKKQPRKAPAKKANWSVK